MSDLVYKVKLPPGLRKHLVFLISLLKLAPLGVPLQSVVEQDKIGEFEIKEILDLEELGGVIKYFIKWKDYPYTNNTQEPIKHLTEYQTELQQFYRRNPD